MWETLFGGGGSSRSLEVDGGKGDAPVAASTVCLIEGDDATIPEDRKDEVTEEREGEHDANALKLDDGARRKMAETELAERRVDSTEPVYDDQQKNGAGAEYAVDEFKCGERVIKLGGDAASEKETSAARKKKARKALARWHTSAGTLQNFLGGDLDGVGGGKIRKPLNQDRIGIANAVDAKRKTVGAGAHERLAKGVENKLGRESKAAETAGPEWFHLPKTEVTPEIHRDLRVLKMRQHLDNSRHYKSLGWGSSGAPQFFQVGTVLDSSHDYLTGRINRKDRKRHIKDELLADDGVRNRAKKRFQEVQKQSQSGRRKRWSHRPHSKRSKSSKQS